MSLDIKERVKERFLSLVKIDTASDEGSSEFPSTESQVYFAEMLASVCAEIGLENVRIDKYCYVSAELASNDDGSGPVIGFISHMDTSPDCSGRGISPIITQNYDGGEIRLKNGAVLSPEQFPSLLSYKNQTIISSDGTTLLGADDKAGIAEILTAMEYLLANPQIKHGKIKIAFTPDEEIGRGVDFFDTEAFGCDFAYTIDGGGLGELSLETFNAASAKLSFKGKSVHPGEAKGVMINAALLAMEFNAALPPQEIPSQTQAREGFYHLTYVKGGVESAEASYIIRDFDKTSFERRKKLMLETAEKMNEKYNSQAVEIILKDHYENMYEILKDRKDIADRAVDAMKSAGVEPVIKPIRGGTDGARLSFMKLPCPNIFTGGHNFHGPYEYIPLESMVKAVEVIVNISRSR